MLGTKIMLAPPMAKYHGWKTANQITAYIEEDVGFMNRTHVGVLQEAGLGHKRVQMA